MDRIKVVKVERNNKVVERVELLLVGRYSLVFTSNTTNPRKLDKPVVKDLNGSRHRVYIPDPLWNEAHNRAYGIFFPKKVSANK